MNCTLHLKHKHEIVNYIVKILELFVMGSEIKL